MSLPKLLTVADIAKLIGWGAKRTKRWLMRRGLLSTKQKGDTRPHVVPRDTLLALEEGPSLLDPGDL